MLDHPAAIELSERLENGRRALTQIENDIRDTISVISKAGDLPVACRAYKSLNDAYDGFDKQRKLVFALLEGMSRETIPEMLTEAGVSNITVDYGDGLKFRFGKNQRTSCSMPDKEGGMAWLRENGGEGLIQETVNSSKLSSFANEYAKVNGKDLPVEFFKGSALVYTSVTKA